MTSEYHNSMSELVYLFVDGETTHMQKEMLFAALADNSDLQQELQEAILIRSTLEQDCSALAVPPETTAAIFQKAGFALPGSAAAGQLSAASLIESVGMTLKSVVLPTLFVMGGAVLATMYFMLDSSQMSDREFAAPNASREQYSALPSAEKGALFGNPAIGETKRLFIGKDKRRQTRMSSERISSGRGITAAVQEQSSEMSENMFGVRTAREIRSENEDVQFQMQSNDVSAISASPLQHIKAESILPKFSSGMNSIDNFPYVLSTSYDDGNGGMPIAISIRGLMNMSAFPQQGNSALGSEFNNIALSIGADISEEMRIGIEGGRQSLRYYTFENGKNENAVLNTSIDWAGVFCRQSFQSLTYSQCTPYAQVTLGGTVSGPSGRFLAGVRWQTSRNFSLSAGLEGSAFLYQKSTNWHSLRSIGLMYDVEVKF